jgi:enoyl-CoA hydratase/carnithine racemase
MENTPVTYDQIVFEISDRIATITLNRPDKLNAWTAQMDQDVRSAMAIAEADHRVRVIVLTGAGRGFCAGADMSLLQGIAFAGEVPKGAEAALGHHAPAVAKDGVRADFQRKYTYFPSLKKPVIAAVNGHAVGLGLILTLYCDLRFASSDAKFGTAFARRGLIAEYGMAWMLLRLVGHANALDILLSARILGAEEAARMGLVNQVFPAETFLDDVRAYALELANSVSPRSMGIIKRQVYDAMFQSLEEATITSEEAMLASLQSDDFREGVAHFIEKRAPHFTAE